MFHVKHGSQASAASMRNRGKPSRGRKETEHIGAASHEGMNVSRETMRSGKSYIAGDRVAPGMSGTGR